MLRRLRERIDRVTESLHLGRPSLAATVLVALVTAGAAAFAIGAFVADLASAHPSSTGAVIFPIVAVYAAGTSLVVLLLDSAVRTAVARLRS